MTLLCSMQRVRFPYLKKQCSDYSKKCSKKVSLHSGVNDTSVIRKAVSLTPSNMHSSVIDTAVICTAVSLFVTTVTGTAVSLTPLCNQLCRLSSRIRSHIREGFTRISGAQGKLFDEKKTEVENLVSGSL
jgi:hypothetical protein